MELTTNIKSIPQTSTTTDPTKYQLTISGISTHDECVTIRDYLLADKTNTKNKGNKSMEIEKVILCGCEMYRAMNKKDQIIFSHCANHLTAVGTNTFFEVVEPMLYFHNIKEIKIIDNTNNKNECIYQSYDIPIHK